MPNLTQELLGLLQMLMPGFLMTMVFYWFAEVPKPSHLERILQALIGTVIFQSVINFLKYMFLAAGKCISFGPWHPGAASFSAVAMGVISGLVLARACNHDTVYSFARKLKITTKPSTTDDLLVYQSMSNRGVILHLSDGRRLVGYMEVFPNNKQSGSFLISSPAWQTDDGYEERKEINSIYIQASDVAWVEFLE